MNSKRKGLGKGLDALLGLQDEELAVESANGQQVIDTGLRELPVEWLQRGQYQPRQDINQQALQELADSISEQGVMQPILVRALGEDSYEIVAGERRWRAAQLAGISTVPVLIRDLSDQQALAIALIENIQRENLNAMEEARGLVRLQEEFNYSQQQVAKAVGKSRSAVANLMRLTTLRQDVATMLERGDLEMGHGRALLALEDRQQIATARIVAEKGLSVRETEALVRRTLQHKESPNSSATADPDITRLQERLSMLLGAGVKIAHRAGGKGKMTISYNSVEELEGILEHIK
ncbi:MAG: chromosome partitioning protein ParB [Gammaproteobacteria bacterium]|nr:MAG: chromosome partitioning protein ParB [Gammaproteobacteria bacterium]RLA54240.1 MAG: chromosome partitioning protein ParB [Gammaproteobacteria bacterium]